jgi:hypothetical protein
MMRSASGSPDATANSGTACCRVVWLAARRCTRACNSATVSSVRQARAAPHCPQATGPGLLPGGIAVIRRPNSPPWLKAAGKLCAQATPASASRSADRMAAICSAPAAMMQRSMQRTVSATAHACAKSLGESQSAARMMPSILTLRKDDRVMAQNIPSWETVYPGGPRLTNSVQQSPLHFNGIAGPKKPSLCILAPAVKRSSEIPSSSCTDDDAQLPTHDTHAAASV